MLMYLKLLFGPYSHSCGMFTAMLATETVVTLHARCYVLFVVDICC